MTTTTTTTTSAACRFLASASVRDGTISLLNCSNGRFVHTLQGHTGAVLALEQLSAHTFASASDDCSIRLWHVSSTQPICYRILVGHEDGVTALRRIGAGETMLASASKDATIKVWNVTSGECVRTLYGHDDWVLALVVMPTTMLVSGAFDRTVRVWNVSTWERGRSSVRCLRGHTDWVTTVAVLSDTVVASGSRDRTIRVWEVTSGVCTRLIRTGHTDHVNCLTAAVLAGNNPIIVSGSADGTLKVWWQHSDNHKDNSSTSSGSSVTLVGHKGWVLALEWLDERRLASASADQSVKVWDMASLFENDKEEEEEKEGEKKRSCCDRTWAPVKFWSPSIFYGSCYGSTVLKAIH